MATFRIINKHKVPELVIQDTWTRVQVKMWSGEFNNLLKLIKPYADEKEYILPVPRNKKLEAHIRRLRRNR